MASPNETCQNDPALSRPYAHPFRRGHGRTASTPIVPQISVSPSSSDLGGNKRQYVLSRTPQNKKHLNQDALWLLCNSESLNCEPSHSKIVAWRRLVADVEDTEDADEDYLRSVKKTLKTLKEYHQDDFEIRLDALAAKAAQESEARLWEAALQELEGRAKGAEDTG